MCKVFQHSFLDELQNDSRQDPQKLSSKQWPWTHNTITIYERNEALHLWQGTIVIWGNNVWNLKNKLWNIGKTMTFAFAEQLYLYGKDYTYKLWLSSWTNCQTITQKMGNSTIANPQYARSFSLHLLHFAYQYYDNIKLKFFTSCALNN